MSIGPFQLSQLFLVFLVIVFEIRSANGSGASYNETSNTSWDYELSESDLVHFLNASTKSDDIVVVLFYEIGCQSSMRLVPLWQEAISQFRRDQKSAFAGIKLPIVCTFLVTQTNKHFLRMIPVTHVPSIMFLSKNGVFGEDPSASLNVLEFEGQRSSATEILKGLRHYLLRFQYSGLQAGNRPTVPLTSISNALTVQVDTVKEMELIVAKYRETMFQRMKLPLDPIMSPGEQDWVRYMLDENDDSDLLYVICQCQRSGVEADDNEALNAVYSAFSDVARVLSLRRDVVFCVKKNCMDEGVIRSYRVVEKNWTLLPESTLDPTSLGESDLQTSISFFCQGILRPSVLWLDRQASAPIIFSPNNRLHAALLIDFHNSEHKERMRQAVVEFRGECKARRVHNLVCYIVPSTDVRFLLQFGIDMWSPMDQMLHSETRTSFPSVTVFPSLIVTDQRQGAGIDYRVLQHPFTTNSIGGFLDSVIRHQKHTEPETAQKRIEMRKNTFGVHLLGTSNMESFIAQKEIHSLIMFYSPTCGHCKRLKVVWNALAKLIGFCGLDHWLKIGMYDVSINQLVQTGINVVSVPEVYFFRHGSNPIKYDIDEAGGINYPIEILEWWLDVSRQNGVEAISEKKLLNLLEGDVSL